MGSGCPPFKTVFVYFGLEMIKCVDRTIVYQENFDEYLNLMKLSDSPLLLNANYNLESNELVHMASERTRPRLTYVYHRVDTDNNKNCTLSTQKKYIKGQFFKEFLEKKIQSCTQTKCDYVKKLVLC